MFVQLKKDFLGKPAGERIDVADSDGQTLIEQGIAELANPGEAVNQLMTKAMAAATAKISESTAATIDGALKQFRDAQSQALRHDSESLHCSIISCGRDYAAQARRPDSSNRLSAKLSISSRRASFVRHDSGIAAAP